MPPTGSSIIGVSGRRAWIASRTICATFRRRTRPMAPRTSTATASTERELVVTAERELVVTRVFDAPRPLVFKASTQPEHLVRWWGPQGFTTLASKMDVRPGGTWWRRMRSPQGTVHVKRGVYREVVAPERL